MLSYLKHKHCTTYYYRVYGRDANTKRTQIYTCVSTPGNFPVNDECSGAIGLVVNVDNGCTKSYSGKIGFATQRLVPCPSAGSEAFDVWFKFVATASTHKISVTPLDGNDYAFEVFGGSCQNLVSLACVNNGGYYVQDVAVLDNLTPGSTYYMRVYSVYGWANDNTPFNICINSATATVDNDDCSGAINIIPVSTTSCDSKTTRYTNIGATQSMEGCFGTAEDDIWFKFTATSSRHRIIVNTEDTHNTVLEVFSGLCSNLISKGCYYDTDTPTWGLLTDLSNLKPGTTYYYRVYGRDANTKRTQIYTCVSTIGSTHVAPSVSITSPVANATLLHPHQLLSAQMLRTLMAQSVKLTFIVMILLSERLLRALIRLPGIMYLLEIIL